MDYQPSTEFGMAKAMIPEHVQMFESVRTSRVVNETTTNNFQTTYSNYDNSKFDPKKQPPC